MSSPKEVLPSFTPAIAARINTVRDRLQQLEHPVPPSEIARITGISKATLIRRCTEGSLPHFRSRGMILLDPAVVLEWYMCRWVPQGQQSVVGRKVLDRFHRVTAARLRGETIIDAEDPIAGGIVADE